MLVQRLFLKEFLKIFSIISAGLAALLSVLNLIKKIDDFAPYDPTFTSLAYYAVLEFPRYMVYTIPMAALLCSLYAVGHASRTRETVAVMSAGGRLRRVLAPFVFAGAVLSIFGFLIGEVVVPECYSASKQLVDGIMNRKRVPSFFREGRMWLRGKDGSLVKIDLYMEEEDVFRGMTVFRLGKDGIEGIIQAGEAAYSAKDDAWVLKKVRLYDLATGNVSEKDSYRYTGLSAPKVFAREVKKPYEMGFFELTRYLDKLREAGFRNLKLTVQMHSKVSYPLVTLFMMVLGVSFAARRNLGGLAATAIGLLISLFYWFSYTMLLSLGYTGIVPPLFAAWAMPALFGAASIYLYTRIPE